jgi:hypothetical protein
VPLDLILAVAGLAAVGLPAVALAWALGRGSSRDPSEMVVLAALPVGLIVLGGLALNLLPAGLGRLPWLAFALAVLAVAWLLARDRELALPTIALPERPPTLRAALVPAAAVLAVAAIVIASTAHIDPDEHFSELWITPPTTAGATTTIGVRNDEGQPQDYRVDLVRDGQVLRSWPVSLAPGETWTTGVSETPGSTRLEALLYRADDTATVYRQVWLAGTTG